MDQSATSASCPASIERQRSWWSEWHEFLRAWAWVPVVAIFLVIVGLRLVGSRTAFISPTLQTTLHFVFTTVTSASVAYLFTRSFLAGGQLGFLALVSGVTAWGLSGVLAAFIGQADVNVSTTIHNLSAWLSAVMHLVGVVFLTLQFTAQRDREWSVLGTFIATVILIGLIVLAAVNDWLPEFFVQGQGGTTVRQVVLGSAILMFLLSAFALRTDQRPPSSFVYWYRLALLLIVVGLFGILIQTVLGSILGWVSRGAQWLGGVYMVIAARSAVVETGASEISLALPPRDTKLRYCLATVFVLSAAAAGMVFFPGSWSPESIFYPALILAAIYGGRGPGIMAALLAATLAHGIWIGPMASLQVTDLTAFANLGFFLTNSIFIIWIIGTMQRAQMRANVAEADVKLAALQHRTDEALREQAELLDLARDAIILRDLDGTIRFWNHGAEAMYGIPKKHAVGKNSHDLLATKFPATLDEVQEALLRSGYWDGQLIHATSRGSRIVVSSRWVIQKGDADAMSGVMEINTDITARKIAEEKLREVHGLLADRAKHLARLVEDRTAKLEEMVTELEAFSYSVSHDMRAPLRAMEGYAQALLTDYDQRLDPQGKDWLERIVRSAKRLDTLVKDVLAYSKVAQGQLELTSVDVTRLIEDIVNNTPEFQPPSLYVSIAKPLHPVVGHEAYLTQCVTNLLGNAVKFVPPGIVPEVHIRSEQFGSKVRIWFEDNGIGVDQSHHDRIFQIFGQVHPETRYGGTGIGLAIVRKAVQRMNGEVGLESELNRGSRFWIVLSSTGTAASDHPDFITS